VTGGRQRAGIHLQDARCVGVPQRRDTQFSRPGKPTNKAFVASYNGHSREECIDQRGVVSLEGARQVIAGLWSSEGLSR
jgi:hypothetical protein